MMNISIRSTAVVLMVWIALSPLLTEAWFFDVAQAQSQPGQTVLNSDENAQTVDLLSPNVSMASDGTAVDPDAVVTIDSTSSALDPQVGTDGTLADVTGVSDAGALQIYTVVSGDTVASIAAKFHVSENTIRFDNELNASDVVHVGDTLVVVPISGVSYVVKKGDTIASVEKKFKIVSSDEISTFLAFNSLDESSALSIGQVLIAPGAQLSSVSPSGTSSKSKSSSSPGAASKYVFHGSDAGIGSTVLMIHVPVVSTIVRDYFIKPIPCPMTQGKHDLYAVDLSCGEIGTPIKAAANGIVMFAKYGWNGGYGNLIIMKHPNGMLTFYAHIKPNGIDVKQGQSVTQGTVIGHVGTTGESTGPHLHFEVRGGGNPGFDYSGSAWKK